LENRRNIKVELDYKSEEEFEVEQNVEEGDRDREKGFYISRDSTLVESWLKLKGILHPNMYQVSWFQKGQWVTVTEQCLLSFQIGSSTSKFYATW
jgi:hypothetical protein